MIDIIENTVKYVFYAVFVATNNSNIIYNLNVDTFTRIQRENTFVSQVVHKY